VEDAPPLSPAKIAATQRIPVLNPSKSVKFISSGCTLLDQALGGGWAEKRIANIIGDKSAGKTLLAIEVAANFHLKYPKGRILYREAEAAFDRGYAKSLGMPIEAVDFGNKLDTVEEFFDDMSAAVKFTKPSLYVLDSLDALSDDAEMQRGLNEPTYGTEKARKLSQLFRRLVRDMSSSNLTLIIISQIRSKIGWSMGRTTTRSGGRALDFYASQVLYLSHLGRLAKTIEGIKRPIGLRIGAMVDKNKVGPPLREAEFTLQFGYGIDDLTSCVNWLAEVGKLDDIELTNKKGATTAFIKEVNGLADHEYTQKLAWVQGKVRDRWNMIETTFLPKRHKYGNGQD
jgi:recombination protein RecA